MAVQTQTAGISDMEGTDLELGVATCRFKVEDLQQQKRQVLEGHVDGYATLATRG